MTLTDTQEQTIKEADTDYPIHDILQNDGARVLFLMNRWIRSC